MKINVTIVLGLVFPALVVAGAFPTKRIVQRSINKGKVEKLEAHWRTLGYSPIIKTTNFCNQVREEVLRRTEAGDTLSQPQKDELARTVTAFLLAYSARDYDQYKSFRLPTDSDARTQLNKLKAEWVVGQLGIGKIRRDNSTDTNIQAKLASFRPEGLVRDYYSRSLSSTNSNGKSIYCVDCWKGIAFDTMRLRVNRFTNQIVSVTSVMWKEHSLNGVTFPATVEFKPAPGAILEKHKELSSVYFSAVMQTDTSVTNHSVYFHWYWDPEIQRWLPYEFRGAFAARTIGFVF